MRADDDDDFCVLYDCCLGWLSVQCNRLPGKDSSSKCVELDVKLYTLIHLCCNYSAKESHCFVCNFCYHYSFDEIFVTEFSQQLIGGYRACAVRLYRLLSKLPVSEPVEESHHVSLRFTVPSHASRCRPRMRQLSQLVLHAAVTTSACDVITAADKLLPVNGRVAAAVPGKVGRVADVE